MLSIWSSRRVSFVQKRVTGPTAAVTDMTVVTAAAATSNQQPAASSQQPADWVDGVALVQRSKKSEALSADYVVTCVDS